MLMLNKSISYALLGLGVVFCIGGGISMIIFVDILNFTITNYQVWLSIGSVLLGLLCLLLEFIWSGNKGY